MSELAIDGTLGRGGPHRLASALSLTNTRRPAPSGLSIARNDCHTLPIVSRRCSMCLSEMRPRWPEATRVALISVNMPCERIGKVVHLSHMNWTVVQPRCMKQ